MPESGQITDRGVTRFTLQGKENIIKFKQPISIAELALWAMNLVAHGEAIREALPGCLDWLRKYTVGGECQVYDFDGRFYTDFASVPNLLNFSDLWLEKVDHAIREQFDRLTEEHHREQANPVKLFEPGRTLVSEAASYALKEAGTTDGELLKRHVSGDWGLVSGEQKEANDKALGLGKGLVSRYTLSTGKFVFVMTDDAREATTIVLQEEAFRLSRPDRDETADLRIVEPKPHRGQEEDRVVIIALNGEHQTIKFRANITPDDFDTYGEVAARGSDVGENERLDWLRTHTEAGRCKLADKHRKEYRSFDDIQSFDTFPYAILSVLDLAVRVLRARSHPTKRDILFHWGLIRLTPGAELELGNAGLDMTTLLARHVTGDWGDIDIHMKWRNDLAVKRSGDIHSIYKLSSDHELHVTTVEDRSATVMFLWPPEVNLMPEQNEAIEVSESAIRPLAQAKVNRYKDIKYPRPPIVEVVCEFRFEHNEAWDLVVPGLIYQKLKDTFPVRRWPQRNARFETTEQSGQGVNIQNILMQFHTEDGKALVQVGPGILAINHLSPYPGWEGFRSFVEQALHAYISVIHVKSVHRVGLRYLNRFFIDPYPADIQDYFAVFPSVSPDLPQELRNFMLGLHLAYNDERDLIKVQLAPAIFASATELPSESQDKVTVLLDLDYFLNRTGAITLDSVLEWIDEAHVHLQETFEACITDVTRAQLQFGEG